MILFTHLECCNTWDMVPFGSQLEVLVPLGPLVRIATTRPTTSYATMVIPSYEVSAASGALVHRNVNSIGWLLEIPGGLYKLY